MVYGLVNAELGLKLSCVVAAKRQAVIPVGSTMTSQAIVMSVTARIAIIS